MSYSTSMSLLIGGTDTEQLTMLPNMATRHGIITGATGTGKTVTVQILAENFSKIGVPVFVADVKGDVAGISQPGKEHPKVDERIEKIGIEDFSFSGFPVTLWDVFGKNGHPVRTTVSEMGPLLLSRLLDLSDAQTGVLYIAFKYADDNGMLLLDLKDLRTLLDFLADNQNEISSEYGRVSTASVGSIQRSLLELETQGGDQFFGEPALRLEHLMRVDLSGKGMINILDAQELMSSPIVYSTFLLWLLSELFEQLPEAGEVEKPKLVFFFDEAHLLFDDTPKALQDKIEQLAKLIRSKGVGVYFVTQNPLDIPDPILSQLGNRIQHALRAYTPREQKAVRAAAGAFRVNPDIDTEDVITQLGVGEALVSVLDEEGAPRMVERTLIRPPHSRIGPIANDERSSIVSSSLINGVYENVVDRHSAHEMLLEKAKNMAAENEAAELKEAQEKEAAKAAKAKSRKDTPMEAAIKSAARSIGSQLGRQIIRGILGSLTKR